MFVKRKAVPIQETFTALQKRYQNDFYKGVAYARPRSVPYIPQPTTLHKICKVTVIVYIKIISCLNHEQPELGRSLLLNK